MSVIDDYLKTVTPSQRVELERIRKITLELVPNAEETIGYGIPTLKYNKKYLIYFAAFKNHMSVFPGSALTAELKEKLSGYTFGKGTIQFTEAKPLPESVIKEIIRSRLDKIG